MLSIKELKPILRKHDIRPSKRLGQNFLIDKNIQKRIIDSLGLTDEDVVLEIGPGLGALTKDISLYVKKMVAVEKDRRFFALLMEENSRENLEITQDDILKYDFKKAATEYGSKLKVVGNLPYYISSPIVINLIEQRDVITSAFITVQKEFAERLVAAPGTKTYGSISCFIQFYAKPDILFNIKKNAFYPAPKVDSSFVKIEVRSRGLYLTDEEKLFKIIRTCFEKRRKTILNSLYSRYGFISKGELKSRIISSGVSPEDRPETISLEKFAKITDSLGDFPL